MSETLHVQQFLFSSDEKLGAYNKNTEGSVFSVRLEPALVLPDAKQIQLRFLDSEIWNSSPNIDPTKGQNNVFTITGLDTANVVQVFSVTIPKGIYSISNLESTILNDLQEQGAKTSPAPIFNLQVDEATSRVIIVLNYKTTRITFFPDTIYDFLGWNLNDLLVNPIVNPDPIGTFNPYGISGPNEAKVNALNYWTISTDFVPYGIPFNGENRQTIAKILITSKPNRQNINDPRHPYQVDISDLGGSIVSSMTFYLRGNDGNTVDTNGENWSFRFAIDSVF